MLHSSIFSYSYWLFAYYYR